MRPVIAFDGSGPARTAVERAAALLGPAATEAVVVSIAQGVGDLTDAASAGRIVLPDEVVRTAALRLREATLAEASELAEEGARLAREAGFAAVRPETRAADGPVWSALADAAREAAADVVVCGTHGRGPAARAILGSVASGVAHHSDVPVLAVPEDAAADPGPLVIGWDGSDHAARAVAACGRLMPGRRTLVIYVWRSRFRHRLTASALRHAPLEEVRDAIAELDTMTEQWAREDAEAGAARAGEAGLDATPFALESDGAPSAALLDAATEAEACAIAVGRRGRGAVASALLGSVSRSLLHAADRPVLVT